MRGDKSERILRIMTVHKEPMSKRELAMKAGCSRKWVRLFLQKLEAKGLVKGTEVVDKKGLVQHWISIHKPSKVRRNYAVKQPNELLKKAKMEYAVTCTYAENLVHHYLFPTRAVIYIKEEDLKKWHEYFMEDGLYGGGNMQVIVGDPHVLYGKWKLKGLWLVSVPQLIVDLWYEHGPSREAAEMMLENVSKY